MSALTAHRIIKSRDAKQFVFPVADSATVYAGAMLCLDTTGKAVPASGTAGLTAVVGVAQYPATGGGQVNVQHGCFAMDVKPGDAPTRAHIGTVVYAADDHTVMLTQGSAPKAGVVMDVNDDGAWVAI